MGLTYTTLEAYNRHNTQIVVIKAKRRLKRLLETNGNKMEVIKKAVLKSLVTCAFLCLSASCGRVGLCYIKAPAKKAGVELTQLHFFFDKTESIQGFTAKGDDSHYVKTMPLLWQVANTAFTSSATRFFDYGTEYTNEFKSAEAINYVKREVLRHGFYESEPTGGFREAVKRNGGQPFSAVADYIGTLDEPGSAYIVVTDFYEQNRENPFFLFFRDAFSHGFSGALFAVESSFSGRIHSFSYVDNAGKNLQVRDGVATFFICIVGDSDIVYAYSAALSKELNAKKINFHDAVFMVNAPGEIEIYHSDPVMAPNKKRYDREENALKLVNLRQQEITIINPNTSSYRIPESYQILTKTGSRWAAGLALQNINPESFKYKADFSLSYFNGKRAKDEGTEPAQSQFMGKANSTVAGAKVKHISEIDSGLIPENADMYPIYLVVETKNSEMEKGWFKINHKIIPEAIPQPDWVSGLNAEDIPALEASAKTTGGHIKVLELVNVYEKIAGAYNALAKIIYSDELYLLKR
jgi:hypothetical protein